MEVISIEIEKCMQQNSKYTMYMYVHAVFRTEGGVPLRFEFSQP